MHRIKMPPFVAPDALGLAARFSVCYFLQSGDGNETR